MMAALSSLSFAAPWVLLSFAALPLLYWLLKVIPPKPRHIQFPAFQLLLSLQNSEQTSRSMPWWLLAIRLLLAVLIIITLAGPRLNAEQAELREGPLVIFVDNNWQLAPHWPAAEKRLSQLIDQAQRANRLVALVPLSAPETGEKFKIEPVLPDFARDQVSNLTPRAVPLERLQIADTLPRLRKLVAPEFIWIASQIGISNQSSALDDLFQEIEEIGPLAIYQASGSSGPHIIGSPSHNNGHYIVPLLREVGSQQAEGVLIGKGDQGKILFRQPYLFEAGKTTLQIPINLPVQLTNQLERLELEKANSAASIYLLDSRWRRPEIGLVTRTSDTAGHMLLDERHYIEKALLPYYTVTKGDLLSLIEKGQPFIALLDTGRIEADVKIRLESWIEEGGTLIRFAGPQLAAANTDLTPVRLRTGNRNLDGSISWGKPARLGPMPKNSPFAALSLPEDILIRKQVLAIPSPDLNDKTWARLNDGTPLVTADRRGSGFIVLFHTTASTAWSNLALSGLFVEMLREIGMQIESRNSSLSKEATLPPVALLDGQGKILLGSYQQPPLILVPDQNPIVSGDHPAGYYGDEENRYGLNIGATDTTYEQLNLPSLKAPIFPLENQEEINLRPALLGMIFLLLLTDLMAMIFLQGRSIKSVNFSATTGLTLAVIGTFFLAIMPSEVTAQEREERVLQATLQTRLGYIMSGDAEVDRLTAAGMRGISQLVSQRTSVEVGEPMEINLEQHDLLFYPFVYWPITSEFPSLSNKSIKKIRDYMANGGTLLIDTRNQIKKSRYGGSLSNSPENRRLQSLMARLEVPRLTPVPVDHVLTRAFYLMQAFPGRYADGEIWIAETADMIGNDGVSPILIGSNDWAAAWAINDSGRPLVAVSPGGPRQRELARRFGINMVMYTLTGSYKSDQVHIPAILERLGQ